MSKKEIYTRDSIQYELSVEQEEGKLWGVWYCIETGEKGNSSKGCDTEDEALLAAQSNLSGYHHNTFKKTS